MHWSPTRTASTRRSHGRERCTCDPRSGPGIGSVPRRREENWRRYGAKGLKALQVAALGSQPWALADPRLCLTLPFWMPLLSSSAMAKPRRRPSRRRSFGLELARQRQARRPPLFTYRHPWKWRRVSKA